MIVRWLLRYYGPVRLLGSVHTGIPASGLPQSGWRRDARQPLPSSPGSRTWCFRTCCRSLAPGSRNRHSRYRAGSILPSPPLYKVGATKRSFRRSILRLCAPLRIPPRRGHAHRWASTPSLKPKRAASPYSAKDFHLLHHAGFDRRFHNVPLVPETRSNKWALSQFSSPPILLLYHR